MVFQADTLRDSIDSAWALAGRTAKAGAAATGVYPVYILAWKQSSIQEIQARKAVEIRKQTPLQNVVENPNFQVINDIFEITCYYELADVDASVWDVAEGDIEDMCEEVTRILATIYNPSSGTGSFFTAASSWSNEDDLRRSGDPILRRVLRFTLSKVQSEESEVFEGFGGVLTFDVSESANMDSAPGGDYIYTEATKVRIREGTGVTEVLTKDTANGIRVPKLGAGRFRGFFTASIFAKKSDIGTTAEKLNRIYILQANGQHVEAAFLHAVDNTEGSPVTLSTTSYVKVTEMEKIAGDTELVGFNISGRLIKPSTMVTA